MTPVLLLRYSWIKMYNQLRSWFENTAKHQADVSPTGFKAKPTIWEL